MNIEIIEKPYTKTLHGFSGTVTDGKYGDMGFKLMNRMWEQVKGNNLKHKGINIWVYEIGEKMFAGVELGELPQKETSLELKEIQLSRYAYYKHTGPYSQLQKAGREAREQLNRAGHKEELPYIEIYGHWKEDETKLETELLFSLK